MGFGKILFLVVIVAAVYVAYLMRNSEPPPKPVLKDDVWWGPGEPRKVDESIRPFKIQISNEVIVDLNERLDRFLKMTLTPPLETIGFQYGFNSNYLREVITYWRNKYQWKDRQAYLNQYPHFKTTVNGLDLHFIRVAPKNPAGKKVLPLLLLHGWPGSIREFYDSIPLLTTPRDDADFVFEVVVPSLPGYGFSQGAAKPGLGNAQMAVVLKNLMKRIGFQKFYVQGGDWGAMIGSSMSALYPTTVLGFHSNMCYVNTAVSNLKWWLGSFYPSFVVEEEHKSKMYPVLDRVFFILEESGYMHIQATKPDTIGVVLRDTPAGMAAYILEKFSTWTNPAWKSENDGGLTKKFTLDALLDNIMIYWVTGSITTSQRLYAENFRLDQFALRIDEIPVITPTACVRFGHELSFQSEYILKDKYINMLQLRDFNDGGHFAAFELPKTVTDDVWSAVKKFQAFHLGKKEAKKSQ